MTIPYLSICSGIEAFSVAVEDMPEFVPVAFSEIEDFPSKVLAYHWPQVPNLGDFTRIDTTKLGHVAWLVGGPPCQSFSVAGLRAGLDDDRGNLTLEYVRLAHALASGNGLRGALFENVPGILSSKDNAYGCFLGAIVGHDGPLVTPDGGRWPDVGMVAGPRARAAWRILDSQHLGVPQRRRRVFVVIDFGEGPDPVAVLFEPRGQVGGVEASGEAGQEIAGTLASRSAGGGGLGTDMDLAGGLQVAHTLRGEGFDASEDGSGRGTPLVVSEYGGNAEGGNPDVPSLNAPNGKKGINNQTRLVMVFDPNQITSKANRSQPAPELSHTLPATSSPPVMFASDTSPTLRAGGNATGGHRPPGSDVDTVETLVVYSMQAGATRENPNSGPDGMGVNEDIAYTIEARAEVQAVAFNLRGREGGNMPELGTDQASALRSADGGSSAPMVMTSQVRRLTPVECERLQSFPDNHTLIPGLSGWRDVGDDEDVAALEASGLTIRRTKKSNKLRVNDPDGPRYKALGNSFTVFVVRAIMRRVRASLLGLAIPPMIGD